jgi:hypothetical protein
MTPRRDLDHG